MNLEIWAEKPCFASMEMLNLRYLQADIYKRYKIDYLVVVCKECSAVRHKTE